MKRLYPQGLAIIALFVVAVVTSWGASGDMVRYVSEPRFTSYSSAVNARFNALGGVVPGTVYWSNVQSKPSSYVPAAHTQSISTITGLQTELDAKPNTSSLAPVATSGAYTDLTGTPTLVNPDWSAASGLSQILNKPTLGTAASKDITTVVATTGASDTKVPTEAAVRAAIAGSVAGVSSVISSTTDIAVENGTSTPTLTLNTGTGAGQVVKLDNGARLPAVDGSQLTNVPQPDVTVYALKTRTINGHALTSDVTVTKADINLDKVENTAISTWAGSTGLITLGTVTTGTWHGSAIGDDYISSAAAWNAKQPALGFTPLAPANNLSDVGIPATARANLGLGNVDNTSDASKPISAATQTALNAKQSLNLIDTVTGTVYRLSIDNGVLQLEEQ